MLKTEELQRIYLTQKNDTWLFKEDKNGHSWKRIAKNNEVVGSSHTQFATAVECKKNAKMVGYSNKF